jgi:hypothetical protein
MSSQLQSLVDRFNELEVSWDGNGKLIQLDGWREEVYFRRHNARIVDDGERFVGVASRYVEPEQLEKLVLVINGKDRPFRPVVSNRGRVVETLSFSNASLSFPAEIRFKIAE